MSLEIVLVGWNRFLTAGAQTVARVMRGLGRGGLPLAFALLAPSLLAQPDMVTLDGHKAHPTRVLAKFAEPANRSGIAPASLNTLGAKIVRRYDSVPGLVLLEETGARAPASLANPDEDGKRERLVERIQALKASGLFEYVEPDYYGQIFLTPTDAAFVDGRLWGLQNLGQNGGVPGADISAVAAWDLTTGSTNVIVAVIDTGIWYTHQDLATQMWHNPGEIPNNGIDDDDNGYIDDVYGVNAVMDNGDPLDDHDHGTHVAGTIGAAANNGRPHVGVAWRVRLMACKVFDEFGFGSTADVIVGVDYAVRHGAKILNNSYGVPPSQAFFDSIRRARDQGVLFVAAAGNERSNNDRTPVYPANYQLDNIISVAAVDRADNLASFSNWGERTVHLGAPGVDIFSSVAGFDSNYDVFDGTSMATPHVCGVAALVMSYFPGVDLDEVRGRILSSTVPITSLNRRTITGGRVNAYNALTLSGDGLLQVSVDPPSGSTLLNGSSQPVVVRVRDRFSVRDATVTGLVAGGATLVFANDGQDPDAVADDAYYSATLPVPLAGDSLAMVLTVTAPGKVGVTNTLTYSLAPMPLNDPFASPIKAPVQGGRYDSNNRFATLEPGEPPHSGDTNAVASLWWTWTGPSATNVLVDATGTAVDSVLAVYTGNTLTNLQLVARSTNLTGQRTHLFFDAQASRIYSIALAGAHSNALGSVRLRIAPGGKLQTEPPVVAVTSPRSGMGTTNSLLTVNGTAADTGPDAAGVTEVLVSLNDAIASPANGTTIWDRSVVLRPGLNRVRVRALNAAGLFSETKTVDVHYLVPRPANDDFNNAVLLSGSEGSSEGENSGATLQLGEPQHASNAGGRSVWWRWTAPADGSLLLSTEGSSFDTLLGLYTGNLVNTLTTVASNDDAFAGSGFSKIQQAVRSQTVYQIAVDGYNGATGVVKIAYTFVPATVYSVALSHTDGGVTVPPAGQVDVEARSAVQLLATPNAAFEFVQWEGDVNTAENPVSVPVPTNLLVRAVFRALPVADDFETGDLSRLPWQTSGAVPWSVTSQSAAGGTYSARAGTIGHNQSSILRLTQSFRAGAAAFDYRVSSEASWDFLEFYVDGVRRERWSGEVDWTRYSFAITAGQHTLEWRYTKDAANSLGLDTAFLDNVILPLDVPSDGRPSTLSVARAFSGGVEIRLKGQTNQIYQIQAAETLPASQWRTIHTGEARGGELRYLDPESVTLPRRYYRAVGP
jgi:subtilisin family serine protease